MNKEGVGATSINYIALDLKQNKKVFLKLFNKNYQNDYKERIREEIQAGQ